MTDQQQPLPAVLLNPSTVTSLENYLREYNVQGSSGAELNIWNEKYFVDTHVPKTKYALPSLMTRRTACINLLHFFTGKRGLYEGWIGDFQTCILSMRAPGTKDELLFVDFLKSESGTTGAPTYTVTIDKDLKIGDGYADIPTLSEEAGPSSGAVLAGDVDQTKEDETSEQTVNLSVSAIKGFWEYLFNILTNSAESKPHAELPTAEVIMGLICMNCFKLISKPEESVFKSMTRNLHKHYVDIFRPREILQTLCPPHITSLTLMKAAFGSISGELLDCLTLMITRVIIENSKNVPTQSVIGLLYSACLTHVGMHGLAAVKHVEQTALAMGLPIARFASMIMTTRVKDSLLNVLMLLKIGATEADSLNIMGKIYRVPFQFSWRFCRIYNQAHFSRFVTANNVYLILRCAAYMGHLQDSSTILAMKILQGPRNQAIFEREKTIAQRYFDEEDSKGDAPLVEEARNLYENPTTSRPIQNSDYDRYLR